MCHPQQPLENEIISSSIPALFGASLQESCDDLRPKSAGLAAPNPVSTCAGNYQSLTVMPSHLLLVNT
jgi:hypothetical protein